LQRDRDFANYQDLAHPYHETPSVWIEPRGNWGEGEIHLVELPTQFEGLDNIVAFWNPKERPQPMQPFRYAYMIQWSRRPDANFAAEKVLQTRIGTDHRDRSKHQVIIDFDAKSAGLLRSETPQAAVHCSKKGMISNVQVFKNEPGKSWRVSFNLGANPENKESVDISCALRSGEKTMSETWSYQWHPSSKKPTPQ
jgi:periplasmic glucans biosynthesis protein